MALIAAVVVAAGSACAQESCDATRAALERVLDDLPRACRADDECEVAYLRADACRPPVPLRAGSRTAEIETRLLAAQRAQRDACAASWSRRPACAPIPARAACVAGRCEAR